MKLDTRFLRYLTSEDWRVLTAVEMGSKNHEVVPTTLIIQLSSLGGGSAVHKSISTLAKANLIARMKNAKYDGYRLTYGGLDYLALHTHLKRNTLYSTGNCIGVGKESDIYVCASPTGKQLILKIHRLGRISFRSIKNNRDYLKHRSSASWMYMSRLSALKEFSFLKVLRENEFRVPEPVAQNRHTVVMELVDAFPLRQINGVPDSAGLYAELIEIVMRLAKFGLIHGDFNEFNILIREDGTDKTLEHQMKDDMQPPKEPSDSTPDLQNKSSAPSLRPVIIDLPQMVSMDHPNAAMYFDRDIKCIKNFFKRRFNFVSDEPGPFFIDAKKLVGSKKNKRLDVEVEASGFSKKMAKELEKYMQAVGADKSGEDEEDRRSRNDGSEELYDSDGPADDSPSFDDIPRSQRGYYGLGRSDIQAHTSKTDEDVDAGIKGLSIQVGGSEQNNETRSAMVV
ncbi:Serine/threonine-protein kinase rio2 [Lecanora helva]